MDRRNEHSLNDLLEYVAFEGFASIPKWRLTRWYDQQHYSVTIRRDLRERWKRMQEDLDVAKPPILKLAEVSGNIVLMNSENFSPDRE